MPSLPLQLLKPHPKQGWPLIKDNCALIYVPELANDTVLGFGPLPRSKQCQYLQTSNRKLNNCPAGNMNQFTVVKPESSKTLAWFMCTQHLGTFERDQEGLESGSTQIFKADLENSPFSPLPWVHPSCGQRQPGICITPPWEVSTAETSGRAALKPQIQQHRQAGNTKLHFLPEDTFSPLHYKMHI